MGLDVEPDDGLLVGVEDAERDLARADPAPPARARASRSRRRGGALRSSARSWSNRRCSARAGAGGRRERLAGRAVGQRQLPAGVAQRQPAAVQAAVERVVERARARRGCGPAVTSTCSLSSARASARSAPSGNRWVTTAMPARVWHRAQVVNHLFSRRSARHHVAVIERLALRGAGGEPVDFVRTAVVARRRASAAERRRRGRLGARDRAARRRAGVGRARRARRAGAGAAGGRRGRAGGRARGRRPAHAAPRRGHERVLRPRGG